MTGNWIVLGDATSSGGRMITCSPFTDLDGKGVCRKGDKATCPQHKGVFPITGGCDPTTIIDDEEVALHGATVACGCKVLSTQQMRVFLEAGGGVSAVKSSAAAQVATALTQAAAGGLLPHDEAFVLISELTGKPLANRQYKLIRMDGATEEGTTDDEGKTHVATSDMPEGLHVEIGEEKVDA
ncbi:PAAR domain-containing protein [Lysobacter sp. A378]